VFAIGGRESAFFGNNVNGSPGNEVAIHTDNRAIGQLVVSKGLLLGAEFAEFSPQGFNCVFEIHS
jgi:hypothetical protein